MKYTITLLIVAIACMFQGCDGKKVSSDKAEQNMAIAKANATRNAKLFIANDPRYAQYGVVSNGDSSINEKCPNGDGWATIQLISPDNTETVELKCSSTSLARGCLTTDEFKKRPDYIDRQCNPETPDLKPLVE